MHVITLFMIFSFCRGNSILLLPLLYSLFTLARDCVFLLSFERVNKLAFFIFSGSSRFLNDKIGRRGLFERSFSVILYYNSHRSV